MSARIDLSGQKFGTWTVIRYGGLNSIRQSGWICRCDCGGPNGPERFVVAQALRTGASKSCGCQKSALITKARTQHGRAGTKAYQVWGDMVRRCTSQRSGNWANYGGRGIKVCDAWLKFENWNADMGDPPPGMSLERIDNNGNYERSNCKWATVAEQNQNKRGERDLFTGRYSGHERSLWAPEYRAWMSMRTRCSPGNKWMAPLYSDRGIAVCLEWQSFEQFLKDMGPIPHQGWTLDRKDNDLGYYPDNCRWADCQTQAQNRRQNQRNTAHRRSAA